MNRINIFHVQGFALITVLWITAFLAVIASAVSYQSRGSLKLANNVVASFETRHAAEGALLLTANKLIKRDDLQGLVIPDPIYKYEMNDVAVTVSIADESGKVDINLAPIDLLSSLFTVLGVEAQPSASLANAIADWRDEDNLKRLNGAEDQDYLARGLPYQAKDDEFDSIEEVSLVLGVSSSLFNRIKPYITVYSQDLGVNTSLASSIVNNAVQNVIAGSNSQELSGDYVTATGGLIYTLHAQATEPSGITSNIVAIIRLQRGNVFEPFTILGWKQS